MLSTTLILTGFMASGKSRVARLLAEQYQTQLIDLDQRLVEKLGDSISQVFRVHGEKYFREQETETLQQTLEECAASPAIISTGGGIVTQEVNRAMLEAASQHGMHVIYLRASPQTLAKRIRRDPGTRPLIDGEKVLNLEETVERVKVLLEARRAFYESCADIIIDTDCLSLAEVVEKITATVK